MKRDFFAIALFLSLAIHLFSGTALWLVPHLKKLDHAEPISIEIVENPVSKPEEKNSTQQPQASVPMGQVVEQDEKRLNDEIDENTRFLSQHNQKVVEQTRARESGRFNNEAGNGLIGKAKTKEEVNEENKKDKAKEKMAKSSLEDLKSDTGLPTLESLKPQFAWKPSQTTSKTETMNKDGSGLKSQSDDYIKDVNTGVQTLLSSREFVYYSYYKRIKNQLGQYWEPKIKEKVVKLFRQGREIASTQERVTKLLIVLNSQGTIVAVKVLGESGVRDLDEAAIEAFKEAAPFPNPPKGIVESDGTIKIRWDFVLEA